MTPGCVKEEEYKPSTEYKKEEQKPKEEEYKPSTEYKKEECKPKEEECKPSTEVKKELNINPKKKNINLLQNTKEQWRKLHNLPFLATTVPKQHQKEKGEKKAAPFSCQRQDLQARL